AGAIPTATSPRNWRLVSISCYRKFLPIWEPVLPMSFKLINPEALRATSGYSNGLLVDGGGKLLFIAGQIAWDNNQKIVSDDFVEQFDKALANVITVLRAAGGEAENIARLVIYVTNKIEYRKRTREVGDSYR